MKKKIVSIVSLLTAIIMGTSIIACGDDDGIDDQRMNVENISLELKGLSSAFPSQQGSAQTAQLMEVICNTSWFISSMPLWIDVDASGGNGNKSVRVWTNEENATGVQRSGIIIVKAGNIEKSIEVVQNPIGDDDDDVFVPISTRTLVVTLIGNGASTASVKYAGITGSRAGNNITFENAPATGALKVTGGTIIPQTVNINFGDRNTLVIEVNAVMASTNIVPQAAADAGADVTNDTYNQSSTGVSAKLNLGTNGSTASYASADKNYSLTVYSPAATPEETLTPNATYTRAPYAVVCKPDGASFTPAVRVDLTVDGIGEIGYDGIQFGYENTSEEALNKAVSGNNVSGDLPHFSTWGVFVTATCTSITEGQEEIARGSLVSGENTVTYNQKYGFSSEERGIIAVWLKMVFGAPMTQVAKTTKFNSNSAGSYVITQKTFTATFKAGNKIFQAKYYGEVTAKGK